MKRRKAQVRLEARQREYDKSSIAHDDGFKRPGSMKKPMPVRKRR